MIWKAGLYHRRSTADKNQHPRYAQTALRAHVAGLADVQEVAWAYDSKTGDSALEEREAGARMLQMVREKALNLLVTLDSTRLSRERPIDAVNTVRALRALGCEWMSATEPELDSRKVPHDSPEEDAFYLVLYVKFMVAHGSLRTTSNLTIAGLAQSAKDGRFPGRHFHACGIPRNRRCPCGKDTRYGIHYGAGPCPTKVHDARGKSRKPKARGRSAKKWAFEPTLVVGPLVPPSNGGT